MDADAALHLAEIVAEGFKFADKVNDAVAGIVLEGFSSLEATQEEQHSLQTRETCGLAQSHRIRPGRPSR